MNARQIELGRHALGLELGQKISYRNRFYASPGHSDYEHWVAMCSMGLAIQRLWPKREGFVQASYAVFFLTREGATACLRTGERLDPEDFL